MKAIEYYSGECFINLHYDENNSPQYESKDSCPTGEWICYNEKGEIEKRVKFSNCVEEK